MSIAFETTPEDDPDFLARVEQTLCGVLLSQRVEECVLVRIDNWFDHKWLGFTGTRVIASTSPWSEVIKAEFHSAKVTLPPFSPGRVISKQAYRWEGYLERFVPTHLRQAVHKKQRSQRNIRRYAADFGPSTVLVWFTGRSAPNGRGSLMIYTCKEGGMGGRSTMPGESLTVPSRNSVSEGTPC
jgi:hypothetical protein